MSRPEIGCHFWERGPGVKGTSIRYSEAFKRQVVEQIDRGKYHTAEEARRAYGIRGTMTVGRWIRAYGRAELQVKRVRIETMQEIDEMKAARKRIRELEGALADAHMDCLLEHAFLEIACERMDTTPEDFKKKHALTLSDVRKTRGVK